MSGSGFTAYQFVDDDGKPEGGQTFGTGFAIAWQRGPLGRGEERALPNGAFVETIIEAVIDRIEFYNNSGFACEENRQAIIHLENAIRELNRRTARRESQGVEGTLEGT